MTDTPEARLVAMGINLPKAAGPAGSYAPTVSAGGLIYVSGQLPMQDGVVAITGRLGDTVTLEQGQAAARLCAINLLAQLRAACSDDLGRVLRITKVEVFVASTDQFYLQPQVANGASELIAQVLGEAGVHSRTAVGVAALPMNAAVEVSCIALRHV